MKRLFLGVLGFVMASLVFVGCGTTTSPSSGEASVQEAPAEELTVEALLALDTSYVGQSVVVRGDVDHVCRHSGRRCILSSESGVPVRVDAKGEIEGFPSDLIGHTIRVYGVLRAQVVPESRVAEMEAELPKHDSVASGEDPVAAKRNLLARMRRWMEENGKDFYLLYYIDGERYEVVGE